MNRTQIIVVSSAVALCLGIYLFAPTKKPKGKETADSGHATPPQQPTAEALDIEEYIAEINSKIEDKAVREKVEQLIQSNNYKELLAEYQKLDKPLARAYYAVKLAGQEKTVQSFVNAGDYNSILIQTAPDEKARNFLSANAVSCYEKAVELDSANTNNRIRLAGAYMESGGPPMQGVSILLDIVKKDSANVDALLMLGKFGIVSGQYDKAIARLEKILYLRPQNQEALVLLSEAYIRQGNKTKAIEMLERYKKTLANPAERKEVDDYIKNINSQTAN